jgi:uncharacterized membrane protein HdeD (DUF308 family)
MESQLLYILITLCLFVGIGTLINGLTKTSGKTERNGESRQSSPAKMVATGILLISVGLLLLYFFNDLLTEW